MAAMKIRDGDNAVVDLAKLKLYCLDATHPRGGCKARQFEARLGMGPGDAESLRDQLLAAVGKSEDAEAGESDDHCQRYHLDVEVKGPKGTATVRTSWMDRDGTKGLRFITCHVV
jgi:hypothetical protein